MYYLKFKTISGWDTRSFEREADALSSYEEFIQLYKFVTLTHEETTTTQQLIRDSSQGAS